MRHASILGLNKFNPFMAQTRSWPEWTREHKLNGKHGNKRTYRKIWSNITLIINFKQELKIWTKRWNKHITNQILCDCNSGFLIMPQIHYNDVIMSMMASQITSPATVYLTVYSRADQRKHQSSASLAFVRGIDRSPVNSLHKGQWQRKCLHFIFNIQQFSYKKMISKCRLQNIGHFISASMSQVPTWAAPSLLKGQAGGCEFGNL